MKRIYIILAALLAISFTNCHAQPAQPVQPEQPTESEQPAQVKTFSVLGDSYSTFWGYIPKGNACWYFTHPQGDNDVIAVEQTWWHQFAQESGYELLLNESYSGSTICNTGYDGADYSDRAFIKRMYNVTPGNPDLIVIFGGTNDSWANAPVGELKFNDWTSTDMYSCLPACCFMLEYFTTAAPETQVVFLLNSELKRDVTEGIINACEHYKVPCLHLKDIEKKAGHPSIKGMTEISRQLAEFLSSLN